METKKMKTGSLTFVLFLIAILLPANIIPAYSQTNSNNLENYLVKISLSPSNVDELNSMHSVGYVNLVNKNGMAVKAPQDIAIGLESDDPSIASVPPVVTIPRDHNYAIFDIKTGDKNGETIISSLFNDKIDYKTFHVGGIDDSMPDDVSLKINLPTHNMHVNSEMPFSVFLQRNDGEIIRAPYDIEINLDYENSLLFTNVDELVIKKGTYYAWGIINTHNQIGNGFLRASFDRLGINVAENIEITSSLPASLVIDVFPKQISADVVRTIDVFVSLQDSEGLPAVTPKDIKLKLFSDDDRVGKKLDERMEQTEVEIKKGEFGYYFQEKINLSGYEGKKILMGASAEDLGIAMGEFKAVRPLNFDDPLAENKTLNIFVSNQMPSNTTAVMVYQISAKAPGNECEEGENESGEAVCQVEEGEEKHPIELLEKGELYPVQTNENFNADGLLQKVNIISNDNSLIAIKNPGSIGSSSSYGTAIISSGERTGTVTLAATLKGVGAGTNETEVVDVFRHVDTMIFSPTGSEKIVVDKNGYFDLFLIALDGKQRPKILDADAKYILNPVNEVLEIKENHSFANSNFLSDSFNVIEGDPIQVSAIPIGVDAELELEANSIFDSQVSSKIEIMIPFDNLDANAEVPYNGIVQLKDLLGNPSDASKDLRINLSLEGAKIIDIPEQITISKGSSYATFPISSNGENGDTNIMASIKGVIGSQTKISTTSNESKLKIFAEGIENPLDVGKPAELTVFVDDENAQSVPGAIIKFVTEPGVVVSPESTRTDETGSVKVDVTANEGKSFSIEVLASASGYSDGKQSFDYTVSGSSSDALQLGLPDWVIYVGIAAMVGIAAVVVVFLKKPKASSEDEDEEYEYEDEI
jgi:hypothetical protein